MRDVTTTFMLYVCKWLSLGLALGLERRLGLGLDLRLRFVFGSSGLWNTAV